MGMSMVSAHVTLSGYASCIPLARGVRGTSPLQLDWTVRAWSIGEESSGTRVLWVNLAYMCVVIMMIVCA